jgi:hypothetical protein
MNDEERATLEKWTATLAEALALDGVEVDLDAVLDLAGSAARSVLRPAAPVTTFLVGFAAGRAAASGTAPTEAIRAATASALARCDAG